VRVTTLGTVAGTALDPTGNWNGFVLSDSNLVWLPALPGDTTCDAADINLWGLAVGRSNNLAVSWLNGQITDLNTKIDPTGGWTLTEATAVNDRGQIIGNGIHNGNRRAFLLTPKLSPTD
jgi:uncharacterized membrane protein